MFHPHDPPSPTPSPAPPAATPVCLSVLRDGQRAHLHNTTELRCEDCDLLNALGLTHQCEFRVCRAGDPCIVQVKSTRIGLSGAIANRILVIPGASSTPAKGEAIRRVAPDIASFTR